MAVDKFKFVSPGIFIDEIDESILEPLPERMGPLIIGRFAKGPGNRPIKVDSFKEFVAVFGAPEAGNPGGEVWRGGEMTAPTYAAYAAQAWLKNNRPATIYRIMGDDRSDATAGTAGEAGWTTDNDFSATNCESTSKGGAYGLFVIPSASVEPAAPSLGEAATGTLAAIWYVQKGGVFLTGTALDGTVTESAGRWFDVSNNTFTVKIKGESGIAKEATFNFQRDSQNFIRKVFNTNPTYTNNDVTETGQREIYWLGETFESNLISAQNSQLKVGGATPSADKQRGIILALDGTGESGITWANHKQSAIAAETGYFFSQDVGSPSNAVFDPANGQHVKNLFKFVALDSGEHANRDYKISIMDLRLPTDDFNKYGTFTVLVRRGDDTDEVPVILERFSNVNLNPNSLNYIARRIGDVHFYYDPDARTLTQLKSYPNISKYVRVVVSDDVANNGAKDGWLPFGVRGPLVPRTITLHSGSSTADANLNPAWYSGKNTGAGGLPRDIIDRRHDDEDIFFIDKRFNSFTASIQFPVTRTRTSSSEGSLSKGTNAFFGYQSNLKGTRIYDNTNDDLLRGRPVNASPFTFDNTKNQYSWIFTLDDLCSVTSDTTHAFWASGSYRSSVSFAAKSGSAYVLTGSKAGFKRFTSPLFGGFDGFDITERDPLRNTGMSGKTEKTSYAYYSLKKAIDITSDSEFLEYDLATMPGITNSSLNTELINSCEARADALAIVDLAGGYEPPHEGTGNEQDKLGSVQSTVNAAKDMALNTSYGCTFYPFVQIRDTFSDSILYVPPSVVALGTFSSSQRQSAVWFAPAGFTRGGLSEGSAGLPVLGVRQRLTSENRDRLYEANINPIASFPAEGIVIFGQKTLQVTQSALDRINVRRLLIFLKKEISRFASTTLFEPNIQATWNSFKGKVEPFLDEVKAGFGLTDYRVILDDTTTTPDLIDRNILYAKIYLKPARAIEFIALDFIITKTGASFDD